MAVKSDPEMGINSWLEDELYEQYLRDRSSVDEGWKQIFEEAGRKSNGGSAPPGPPATTAPPSSMPAAAAPPPPGAGEQLQPLRGAAGRIAENMAASVSIPLATSQRTSRSR